MRAPTPSRRRRALAGVALVVAILATTSGLAGTPAGAGAPPSCEDDAVTLFVCRSYFSFARRNPSASELAYWAERMPAKKTLLLATLGKSVESRRQIIQAYYGQFADRAATDPEVGYWVGEVLKRHGYRRLEAALFLGVDATPADLVTFAYDRILGRSPGAGEAQYWETKAETSGGGAMAAALAGTSEARTTRVRWTYAIEMDRFPDAGGQAYWAERLRTGTSYLELRIALKSAVYPHSSGGCSSLAPPTEGCNP